MIIRKKYIFLIYILISSLVGKALETIQVCIHYPKKTTSLQVKIIEKSYTLKLDQSKSLQIKTNDVVKIELSDQKIKVTHEGVTHVANNFVKFIKNEWGARWKIPQITPAGIEKNTYFDQLNIYKKEDYLQLINEVYIEHYVAGVVEAEAGSGQLFEFYKVQSVICRTYVLANLRRHEAEGFHVCDQVHCQVYRGKPKIGESVIKATQFTKGMVLVDTGMNLVNASFHSNCGGETANSEDVWTYSSSYLKSICDTFCTLQPHAYWERKIPNSDWDAYFVKKFNYDLTNKKQTQNIYYYSPNKRQIFFDDTLKMKVLREDWKLPSAFFHVNLEQDTIAIKGNGFGHGVGLCQEGAMKMSKLGYSFEQILRHYYQNIQLVNLKSLETKAP